MTKKTGRRESNRFFRRLSLSRNLLVKKPPFLVLQMGSASILKVLAGRQMTKGQILDAVLATGYRFSTDHPMHILTFVLARRDEKIIKLGKLYSLPEDHLNKQKILPKPC